MKTSNATPPLLTVDKLSLTFGGVQAIADLSLEVRPGEVLAVIGPNGAGKTSLLNAVTRVFDPSGGQIHFKGQDLTQMQRHQIATLGIARTFQNIELFEAATVLDNLLLGRHRFFQGHWWQQVLRTPALTRLEEAAHAEVEMRPSQACLTACAKWWSLVVRCAPSLSSCFWMNQPRD